MGQQIVCLLVKRLCIWGRDGLRQPRPCRIIQIDLSAARDQILAHRLTARFRCEISWLGNLPRQNVVDKLLVLLLLVGNLLALMLDALANRRQLALLPVAFRA